MDNLTNDILSLIYEIPVLVAGINAQKQVVIFNSLCEELFQYKAEEMRIKPDALSVLLPDKDNLYNELQHIIDTKPVQRYIINDLELATKNGRKIYVNWSLRYRRHSLINDEITWFVGYDVTDEVIMRMKLEESEKRFQIISKATNDAVWDWDLKTDYLWWNAGITHIFGYEKDSVENSIDWWIGNIHPDDRDRVRRRIFESISRGDNYWFDEYRFKRSNGIYATVFDKGFIMKDKDGKPVQMIGGIVDITDKKIFQENLALKTNQLREYSFYNSHKFRGPLARLIALAHLLDIEKETLPSNQLAAQQIQVAAEELDRMIKELSSIMQ